MVLSLAIPLNDASPFVFVWDHLTEWFAPGARPWSVKTMFVFVTLVLPPLVGLVSVLCSWLPMRRVAGALVSSLYVGSLGGFVCVVLVVLFDTGRNWGSPGLVGPILLIALPTLGAAAHVLARAGWRRGAGGVAGGAALALLVCFIPDLALSDAGTVRLYNHIPALLSGGDVQPVLGALLIALMVATALGLLLCFSRTPRVIAHLVRVLSVLVLLGGGCSLCVATHLSLEPGVPAAMDRWLLWRFMGSYVVLVATYMTALGMLLGGREGVVTARSVTSSDRHSEVF